MRKIIQITTDSDGYLYALCNDGSVWNYSSRDEDGWQDIPPIPQGYPHHGYPRFLKDVPKRAPDAIDLEGGL